MPPTKRTSPANAPLTKPATETFGHVEHRETNIRINLTIPQTLYDFYSEQAIANGRDVEQEIGIRIDRCRHYTALSPIYFDDAQRRELESALGHNVSSPGVVLAQLKNAVTLKVDDIDVALPPNLQQRIKSRCFRKPYEEVVKKQVIHGLRVFAGLEPQ